MSELDKWYINKDLNKEIEIFKQNFNHSSSREVEIPFAHDVSIGKNNPVFNNHTYHTKVPHPAIMRYILHYTNPGDVILDAFCGTGMTGVAAQYCAKPDLKDKYLIETEFNKTGLKQPTWGDRLAICNDLSPLATFITYNYNKVTDKSLFLSQFEKLVSDVESELGWMYKTKHKDGEFGEIEYTVFSDVFTCSNCNHELVFFDVAYNASKVLRSFNCDNCNISLSKKELNPLMISEYDKLLNQVIKTQKTVPVIISYKFKGKRFEKKVDQYDLKTIDKINNLELNYKIPIHRMPVGGESRRNDKRGITHVHHFFTKRNLYFIAVLYEKAKEHKYSSQLIFAINSIFNYVNKKQSYLGGGGGISGTYYIASLTQEKNVLSTLKRKAKKIIFPAHNSNVITNTGSALNFDKLKTNSIDYIFTDPPFGANLMYSELNFLWEAWLDRFTEIEEEAIENKHQGKSLLSYMHLMENSFIELYRVLKSDKWMTVEFSNTSAAVWNGIQTALQNAGFIISNVAGLDKKQGSFKAVNSLTAVKQDLVISCYKPSSEFDTKFRQYQNTALAIWDFVDEHLHHLPIHLTSGNSTTAIIERSPKILFDRLIAFYVQKGLPVPIDAGKFQQGLRERFIERDGMFFSNEQVQEYDKKKKENPEFIQLSILVSSEQDGVLWLKNSLTDKSLTYQDIQPEWMQALAGVRKGDVIPELATILEENFLKDDTGKWYTPDPENEADLEKLRTNRLLRQFDGYKEEALIPKTKKIKEVRVEALRAGFKQCYQDKDFKSIVTIGDKTPNNLLMDDEVLLQFYDIASSRV